MTQIPIAAPQLGQEERDAVDRVLRSASLAQGHEVEAFESEFSAVVGDRTCVAVNSGTSALHLGMLAAGIGPGDEVIVPSFTFAATANAVALTGATPVFADIRIEDFCIDPGSVLSMISPRTTAIVVVHLFGQIADMTAISGLADRHGLAVFEDACQAHSARLGSVPAGAFGTFAAFSFYPTKNMTTGEGGMIVTGDEHIAHRARLLRNQGMAARYANEIVGFNARMTEPAAAMGRVQLSRLGLFSATRRANAAYLDRHLDGVLTPDVRPDAHHVYHQYTVRSATRDALAATLERDGVGTGVYYPTPVHRLPAYDLQLDLPMTSQACREVLSLPVHPGLSSADLERIVASVNAYATSEAVLT